MHSLDFDESECNLICFALGKLNENVRNTIKNSGNTENELVRFASAYSDIINDLYLIFNQRDSFTASEIKIIYKALKQFPESDKNAIALQNSIADYCKDFEIELP
nr:hypothetical protein [uncultured Caproiciproducens sp.]